VSRSLQTELADVAVRLHRMGWVANHDGNVTARLEPGRFLATPTATSKADVTADGLLVVDEAGARITGRGKPFSELGLHLAVYRARPDVNAVVHAHPPTATGFAVAGLALDVPMLAEQVVSLGPRVPLVPFGAPGAGAVQALEPYLRETDAVLMTGNGAMAWGRDLEQAYLRLELVEHLAKIALVARQLGGARPIPAAAMPALLEARRKAGLGLAAESASDGAGDSSQAKKVVVACAPAPPGSDVTVYEPPSKTRAAALPSADELAELIRQEIVAALKSG
jgi:L-fuculose-phosphate aldolase